MGRKLHKKQRVRVTDASLGHWLKCWREIRDLVAQDCDMCGFLHAKAWPWMTPSTVICPLPFCGHGSDMAFGCSWLHRYGPLTPAEPALVLSLEFGTLTEEKVFSPTGQNM